MQPQTQRATFAPARARSHAWTRAPLSYKMVWLEIAGDAVLTQTVGSSAAGPIDSRIWPHGHLARACVTPLLSPPAKRKGHHAGGPDHERGLCVQ